MTVHIKQLKGGADVLEQVEFVRDNLHDYVYVEDSCIVFNIPIKVLNTPKLMNQYESALNGELSDLETGDDPELLSLYPTAKFYEETIKNLITRIGTTEGNINTLTEQISQNKGSKVSATAASATGTEVGTITVDGTNVVFKVDLSSYAPKASPALSGNPTAPTQTAGNNSTRIATTAFVTTAINNIKGTVADNLNTLQKIAAAINNNPTYYSTVNTALDNKVNKGDISITGSTTTATEAVQIGSIVYNGNTYNFKIDLSAYAPLASPSLTGTPTAPTATAGTKTTQIATTAFVDNAVTALKGTATADYNTLGKIETAVKANATSIGSVNTALGNKQNASTALTQISTLASAANKIIYSTAKNSYAATDLTAFARQSLLSAADAATARTRLDVPSRSGANASGSWNISVTAATKAVNDSNGDPISTTYLKIADHQNPDLSNYVTKVTGKGLSTNDYTTDEKNKLAGIATEATKDTIMSAATSTTAGAAGLVPAPAAGKQTSFLRGDGTWVVPTDTNNATAQNVSTVNNTYPVLLGYTANATSNIGNKAALFSSAVKVNPSLGSVVANKFVGPLEGTATKAVQDSLGNQIDTTYETKANAVTGLSVSGRTITITKGNGSTSTITTQDNDTHYTTHAYVGASGATVNSAQSNNNVYLNITDNTTNRAKFNIKGTGATGVSSDANGNIIINSTNTTYSVATTTANGLMSATDKTKLDGIANVLQYKGTVANFSSLPTTGLAVGYVYNITAAGGTDDNGVAVKAGDNVAYNGSGWDVLSGTVDLSNYVTKSNTMTGATSSAAGTAGLVPVPAAGKQGYFLRGDGTWAAPANTTYPAATTSANGLMSAADKTALDNVPSTYETKANAITGLSVSGKVITYTKGNGSTGTITTQDTNTTYKVASSTNITINGTLVPSIASGTTNKYLRSDGTWQVPPNDNTHYTTKAIIGASNGTANAATTNGNTYLRIFDDSTARATFKITGSGAATVTSDSLGAVTINSTNTTYAVATSSANGLMSKTDKATFDSIPSVYETKANAITGLSVNAKVITYTKGDGTTGTITTQDTDTHYTTHAYVGASGATVNSAQANGSVYLNITDNTTNRAKFKIAGSGATAVTSDASGNITINSTNTTYPNMTGATTAAGGAAGLVPAPTSAQSAQFLRGDGTWQTPTNTDTHWTTKAIIGASNGTANAATTNGNTYLRIFDNNTARATFKITGTGATGVSSDASGNITITSTNTTYPNMSAATSAAAGAAGLVPAPAAGKQTSFLRGDGTWVVPTNTDTKYTAGTGLSLSGTTFSANSSYLGSIQKGSSTTTYLRNDGSWATPTNTTYAVMTGATTAQGGAAGLVPAPTTAQSAMYLCGNGTWATPTNTDTHWTTKAIVGASNGTANAATTNGNTYLRIFDNSTVRATFKISGTGATSVTSDASGNIVINSTDTNTNTTYTAGTGLSLSGTTFSANSGYLGSIAKGTGTTTYLRNDGSWATPTNTTYAVATQSANGLMSAADKKIVDNLSSTYLGKTAKAASATTADSATTATKFASAQAVSLSGDVTGSVSSQAGWSIATHRRSCILGQSSSTATNPWYKVATRVANVAYEDCEITFLVENTYSSQVFGILKVHIRTGGDKLLDPYNCSIQWLAKAGFADSDFVLVLPTTASPTVELWTKIAQAYLYRRFTVLSEGSRVDSKNMWTLLNASSAGQAASITTAGTQLTAVLAGYASNDSDGNKISTTYAKLSGATFTGNISAAGKTITAGTFTGNLTGNVTGNVSGSSGSCTGNAATATKFASAQTITLAGDVTGSVSSQAGWTINTTRRTCIVGQSSSTATNPWYKVASCTLTSNSQDLVATFLVQRQNFDPNGILRVCARRDTGKMGSCSATWLINNGFDESKFVIVAPSSGYTPELWVKIDASYTRYIFTVLSENTNSTVGQCWTFYPAITAGQSASITTAGTQNISTLLNIKNNANTATKATGDKNGNDITTTYVNLTGAQSISGAKTFTGATVIYSKANTKPSQGQGLYICGADANEGGQINLCAPDSGTTYNGINIDNYQGNLRIIGIPSADGSTRTGAGSILAINPYTKTITGGYTFTGNVTGNCSGSSGSCTGLSAKATGDKNGADITTTYAKLSGATFTGDVSATNHTITAKTIKTLGNDAIRFRNGKYSSIIRNDGNNTYILLTNANDPDGSWNSARPLTIVHATGLCNINGNADTATKFASAQAVSLSGDVTGSVSSQAGWSIATHRRSCILGQSSSTTTNPWYKVATYASTVANDDAEITFLVENTYSLESFGILRVHIRTNGSKIISTDACSIKWLSREGFTESDFVLVLPTTASPTVELWTRIAIGYMFRRFTVLSEGNRTNSNTYWTLLNASSAGQAASITTAGTQLTSVLKSRYINGVPYNGTANVYFCGTCYTAANVAKKEVTLQGTGISDELDRSRIVFCISFESPNTAANPTLSIDGQEYPIRRNNVTLTTGDDIKFTQYAYQHIWFACGKHSDVYYWKIVEPSINLNSTSTFGTLPVAKGGTGQTSLNNVTVGKVTNPPIGFANITSAATATIKSASVSNFEVRPGSVITFVAANAGTPTDATTIKLSITGYNNTVASGDLHIAYGVACKNSEFKRGYWIATWTGSFWICISHPA